MNTHDDTRTGVGTTVAVSHRRAARAGVWFSVASAALALTTACGGSTSSTSSASTATSMPVQTQSATATDTSTASDTTTPTGTTTASDTTTATTTVTSTSTSTTTSTATASASSSPTSTATASGHVVVDKPATYMMGDRLVFTSPTGTLHCGMDSTAIGCQSSQKVTNLPACNDPEGSKGPLVMFENGRAQADCTSQGVFMEQGAKALPYGHSLTAHGVTCTSQPTGVYCIDNATRHSLFASRGYFGAGH